MNRNDFSLGLFSLGLGLTALIGIHAVAGFGITYGVVMVIANKVEEKRQ